MKRGAAVAAIAGALIGCRAPWTVRPIEAEAAGSRANAPFDAGQFATSVWGKAVSAAELAPRFSAHAALVKDAGRVIGVDRVRERVAIDLAPYDGKADLEIAYGQIHGSALRDALPFIQFSQFINQVDYARASNALDERAAEAGAELRDAAPGSEIVFSGALDAGGEETPPLVIPVKISRAPGGSR